MTKDVYVGPLNIIERLRFWRDESLSEKDVDILVEDAIKQIEQLQSELECIRTTDDGWKPLSDEIVALRNENFQLRETIKDIFLICQEADEELQRRLT